MSVEVKVCGITNGKDARIALTLGAKYLGFILYSKSPRKISLQDIKGIKDELDDLTFKSVAVDVCPDTYAVARMKEVGFQYYQFHFPADLDLDVIKQWTEVIQPANLWLAPKIPPGIDFPESLLEFADTFLIDAYSDDKFGGTGKSADWSSFSRYQKKYPDKKWILAGGIGPENISTAVTQIKIETVDVNSAVESGPVGKDESKLKKLFLCLQGLEK